MFSLYEGPVRWIQTRVLYFWFTLLYFTSDLLLIYFTLLYFWITSDLLYFTLLLNYFWFTLLYFWFTLLYFWFTLLYFTSDFYAALELNKVLLCNSLYLFFVFQFAVLFFFFLFRDESSLLPWPLRKPPLREVVFSDGFQLKTQNAVPFKSFADDK